MRIALCFGFVALLGAGALMAAAPGDAEAADQLDRGKLLFRIHCLNCHGADGRGFGPMAELLTVHPANLTTIARRNDGELPTDDVAEKIDGRAEERGHGMREMPVWGLSFQQSDRDSAQEDEIRSRIEDLLVYLETLQR